MKQYKIKSSAPRAIKNLIRFNIYHHKYTLEGMYKSGTVISEYIEVVKK